jgi:membrane-associated HD superfamily phosphohydrolase
MSALILSAHVKQGVELAKEHHLGPEITEIIQQHHGSSPIRFFYLKALNQTDTAPPNIEDFSYPGPRPRSREAALVMLADIVEASSRTLDDPTPTRLLQHISEAIKKVYSSGQLDESELTFKDLDALAGSFQQMLRGLYHHRVNYPDESGYPGGQGKKGKQHPASKLTGESVQPEGSFPPSESTQVSQ